MSISTAERLTRIRSTLATHGQSHLLDHWDRLNDVQRAALLDDIEQINFAALDELIRTHVRADQPFPVPADIQPAPFFPAQPGIDYVGKYADAVKRGVSLIRKNKVAAFTVAGGQGTRLGYDGPKGAFAISPVKRKPLFQLFAESIRGTNKR